MKDILILSKVYYLYCPSVLVEDWLVRLFLVYLLKGPYSASVFPSPGLWGNELSILLAILVGLDLEMV